MPEPWKTASWALDKGNMCLGLAAVGRKLVLATCAFLELRDEGPALQGPGLCI